MNPKFKFKNFLSILGNKFTPKPTNEVGNTPYMLFALYAIPFTIYNLAKEARKSLNKDYMDYEKMEIIFLDIYNNTNDMKNFSESVAKLPYMSGKMDRENIYTFMFKYMLNSKEIKQHIINNNFYFNMDKEQILKEMSDNGYKNQSSSLAYLNELPDNSLKFNVDIKIRKKIKM